jgi:hypothetical protein
VLCPGADPDCPGDVEVVVELEGLLNSPGAEADFPCVAGLEALWPGAEAPWPGAEVDFPCVARLEVLWPGAEADFPCAAAVARPASTA